jgi:hypothetical protein
VDLQSTPFNHSGIDPQTNESMLIFERIMGIEPISSVWKTEVIATIPYPHLHFQLKAVQQPRELSDDRRGPWVMLAVRANFVGSTSRFEGGTQNRTGDKGFAILCLTTWPCHHQPIKGPEVLSRFPERPSRVVSTALRKINKLAQTGFEPVTLGL